MNELGKSILLVITIIFLIIISLVFIRELIISKEKKALYINGTLAIGSLLSLIYTLGGMWWDW